MKKLKRQKVAPTWVVPTSEISTPKGAEHIAPNVMEAAKRLAAVASAVYAPTEEIGEAMAEFEREIRKDEARKHNGVA